MKPQATEHAKGQIRYKHEAALTWTPTGARISLLALLTAGVLIGVLVGCAGLPVATPQPADPTATVPQEATPASAATASAGDTGTPLAADSGTPTLADAVAAQTRHFQGDPEAPVTVIEFGDFR